MKLLLLSHFSISPRCASWSIPCRTYSAGTRNIAGTHKPFKKFQNSLWKPTDAKKACVYQSTSNVSGTSTVCTTRIEPRSTSGRYGKVTQQLHASSSQAMSLLRRMLVWIAAVAFYQRNQICYNLIIKYASESSPSHEDPLLMTKTSSSIILIVQNFLWFLVILATSMCL